MRGLALIAAVAASLIATPCAAQSWERVASNRGTIVYGDRDSIKVRRGHPSAWFLKNYPKPDEGALSERQLIAVDCDEETYDLVSFTSYRETEGRGDVLKSDSRRGDLDMTPVAPGTFADAFVQFICSADSDS